MSMKEKSNLTVRLTRALSKEGVKLLFKAVLIKVGGPSAAQYSAVVDTTIATVFDHVWDDMTQRTLSNREKLRVAGVYEAATVQIYSRLDGGKTPRDDGFFTDDFDGRIKAEELLEGVFLKARDQYEEKKLLHFGRFYGNLCFRPDVTADLGNFLLRAADDLNYRQFILLALAAKQGSLDAEPLRHRVLPRADLFALMREEMQLLSASSFGGYGFLQGTGSWTSKISSLGKDFFELFGLDEIPSHEVIALRQIIEQCRDLPIPSG
jgi:hypothetical protein